MKGFIKVGRLFLVMLVFMVFQAELLAQGTPDQALIDAAKKAVIEKNLPVVTEKIDLLRKNYPQSKFIPDTYVISHNIMLQKDDIENAGQTLNLIQVKWPNSEYLFQALKATSEKLAVESPAKAKEFLDANGKIFTDPTYIAKIDTLCFTCLSQIDGTKYLTEITPFYDDLKANRTNQKTEMLVNLSNMTYSNLIKAKRIADVKIFSKQLQEAMTMLGSPVSLSLIEKKNYLTALYTGSPEDFQKEYDSMIRMLKWTESLDDLQTITNYSCIMYDILMKDKRVVDVKALHKKIIETADKIENANSVLRPEYTSYLNILSQGDFNEYLKELTAIISNIGGNAKNRNDIVFASLLLNNNIPILIKNNQHKTMRMMALLITDGFFRLKEYAAFESYLNQYLFTISHTDYKCAPVEYQPIAELVNNLKNDAEITALIHVFIYRDQQENSFYGLWDDTTAENIHINFQNAITKYKVNADAAASENLAYISALSATRDPGKLVKAISLVVDAMAKIKTKEDAIRFGTITRKLYPTLAANNKIEELTNLHDDMKMFIIQYKLSNIFSINDNGVYIASLGTDYKKLSEEIKPYNESVKLLTKASDIKLILATVPPVYSAVMRVGLYDDATALHEYIQKVLTGEGMTDDANKDNLAYQNGVSKETINGMYDQFFKCLVDDDSVGMKKWLNIMNALAPEHPKSAKARNQFKTWEKGDK